MLPLLLVAAPFVLTFMAIQERTQRCPQCGRRGTLERVFRAREPGEDVGVRWSLERTRIKPEPERWRCRECGAEVGPGWKDIDLDTL